MQTDFDENHPGLDIQILGVNAWGQEASNDLVTDGRDLPWLQDVDVSPPPNGNSQSDVWNELWQVEWRDVVILDRENVKVATYNLTSHDLLDPQNYNTLKQMFISAATVADFELDDDVTSTRPGTPVDIRALYNDADGAHPNLTLQGVATPSSGTAEIREVTYSPDLAPKGQGAPLIISEISPGSYIELFNTTQQEIDLSTVSQHVHSRPLSHSVASLAGNKTIPARSFATIQWPADFTDTAAGGEVVLYRDDLTEFADGQKIDDFVAWGSNPHGSRMTLAQSVGAWTGGAAAALTQNSIQRLPDTAGNGAVAYNTSRPPSPGETIDSAVVTMQVVRYVPPAGFTGEVTFAYTARDANGMTGTGQITVHVSSDARLWQNPVQAMDVDFNGTVQPLDVLLVINSLNQGGARILPTTLVAPQVPPPFLDSSGNGLLEPLDVLRIINFLNNATSGEGEGEASFQATVGHLEPFDDPAVETSSFLVTTPTAASPPTAQADPLDDPLLSAVSPPAVNPIPASDTRRTSVQARHIRSETGMDDSHEVGGDPLDPLAVDQILAGV